MYYLRHDDNIIIVFSTNSWDRKTNLYIFVLPGLIVMNIQHDKESSIQCCPSHKPKTILHADTDTPLDKYPGNQLMYYNIATCFNSWFKPGYQYCFTCLSGIHVKLHVFTLLVPYCHFYGDVRVQTMFGLSWLPCVLGFMLFVSIYISGDVRVV